MRKSILFVSIIMFAGLLFAGCASSLRDASIFLTDEHVMNIETAKENAVKIAEISEYKTCFIRSCLGSHIDQIPHEMVIALDEIDKLLEAIGEDYSLMTDCQKGQILGSWSRLVALGILEIITKVNPGALAGLI